MVDEDGELFSTLAPLEDALEEGEVSVEEESGEDVPDLKHATDVGSPSAEQVEKHKVTIFLTDHGANTALWGVVLVDLIPHPQRSHPCQSWAWTTSS